MKNKNQLFVPFLFIVLITAFFAGIQVTPAFAQEPVCTDAAGGVIPCPPPADIPCGQAGGPACPPAPSDDDNGNQKPTSVPAATITTTPISTVPPDDGAANGKQDWSGTCSSKNQFIASCILALTKACDGDGGSWSKSWIGDDMTITCTVPDPPDASLPSGESTSLPITNSTAEMREVKEDWHKFCSNSNLPDYTNCIVDLTTSCTKEGGTASPTTHEDGATINCNFSKIVIESTPLPLAAADPAHRVDGEWVGGCNFGDNYDFCMEDYKISCNNEGGVYSETHDDEGSNVSCTDTTSGRPAGGFPGALSWAGGGIIGILIGLLLPAVQKVREAAARVPQTREHILLNNDGAATETDDDDEGYMKKAKRSEAE